MSFFRYRIGCRRIPKDYPQGSKKSADCPKSAVKNEKVFPLWVSQEQEGKLVTNGGRVLCVTALGESVFEAQQRALKLADQIQLSGAFLSSRYWLQSCVA